MLEWEKITQLVLKYSIKSLYAMLVLFIGLKVINWLKKPMRKAFEKSKVDEAVQKFLYSLTSASLKVILLTIIVGMLGVPITSVIAVLGAGGFAVGMALQGSLSNFAGGVLILLLRPFTIGDFIEAQSYLGTVKEIQIFYTHLLTPDNKLIVIPNGALSNASLINYSHMDIRRVDISFGVGYESNIKKVKDTILGVISKHELILQDPIPFVRLAEHAESSLVFKVRVWCKSSDYWDIHFDLNEQVKEAFDEANINIPYPHMEVIMNSKKDII